MGFISWVKGAARKVGDFGRSAVQKVGQFAKKIPGAIQKVGQFAKKAGGAVGKVAGFINENPIAQGILSAAGAIPVVGSVARAIQAGAKAAAPIANIVERGGEFAENVGGALEKGDFSKAPELIKTGTQLFGEAKAMRRGGR